ncbi:hypothetical protein CU669_08595 [Paramagnetospirillum kuznetsovii]|uniref:Uncharacterized protein n=1 Tax=Paramagnetospirillum kuznetsovii TaxID=2053833 RepID=A0A364NZ56_9PROT|nr:hypothetical protein CU669_08595 [Paramagnetospirillum kuznetsovii]
MGVLAFSAFTALAGSAFWVVADAVDPLAWFMAPTAAGAATVPAVGVLPWAKAAKGSSEAATRAVAKKREVRMDVVLIWCLVPKIGAACIRWGRSPFGKANVAPARGGSKVEL